MKATRRLFSKWQVLRRFGENDVLYVWKICDGLNITLFNQHVSVFAHGFDRELWYDVIISGPIVKQAMWK